MEIMARKKLKMVEVWLIAVSTTSVLISNVMGIKNTSFYFSGTDLLIIVMTISGFLVHFILVIYFLLFKDIYAIVVIALVIFSDALEIYLGMHPELFGIHNHFSPGG
jgi:hypothetical protein